MPVFSVLPKFYHMSRCRIICAQRLRQRVRIPGFHSWFCHQRTVWPPESLFNHMIKMYPGSSSKVLGVGVDPEGLRQSLGGHISNKFPGSVAADTLRTACEYWPTYRACLPYPEIKKKRKPTNHDNSHLQSQLCGGRNRQNSVHLRPAGLHSEF